MHGAIQATLGHGGILYGPELFVKQQIKNRVLLPEWIGEQRRISIFISSAQPAAAKGQSLYWVYAVKGAKLFSMRWFNEGTDFNVF